MAILNILEYPDPRLRTKAAPIAEVDDELRQLAVDMLETMYQAPGIGLAATQVNVHRRMLVADISEKQDTPHVFINPEILERRGTEVMEEGCLSVPGYYESVTRSEWIRVRALNLDGQPFEMELDGLLAVVVQHEMDHLEGKLFVDYLSDLKRQRIRKRIEKDRGRRQKEPAAAGAL
jgi:peptide deformylase